MPYLRAGKVEMAVRVLERGAIGASEFNAAVEAGGGAAGRGQLKRAKEDALQSRALEPLPRDAYVLPAEIEQRLKLSKAII